MCYSIRLADQMGVQQVRNIDVHLEFLPSQTNSASFLCIQVHTDNPDGLFKLLAPTFGGKGFTH